MGGEQLKGNNFRTFHWILKQIKEIKNKNLLSNLKKNVIFWEFVFYKIKILNITNIQYYNIKTNNYVQCIFFVFTFLPYTISHWIYRSYKYLWFTIYPSFQNLTIYFSVCQKWKNSGNISVSTNIIELLKEWLIPIIVVHPSLLTN